MVAIRQVLLALVGSSYRAWEADACEPSWFPPEMATCCGTMENIKPELDMPRRELLLTAGVFLGASTTVNAELVGVEAAVALLQQVVQENLRNLY